MKHFVYVLRSQRDGKRYIGMTSNIERRIKQHNAGKVISTKYRAPLKLEYVEEFLDKISARDREKYFKSSAGRRFLNKADHARVAELADAHV